jgi:hypothetical protein
LLNLLAFLAVCRVHVASTEKRPFSLGKIGCIITSRKQVAINIHRHGDRRVAEAFLNNLRRQFEPTVDSPVDAPRSIEMPQRV